MSEDATNPRIVGTTVHGDKGPVFEVMREALQRVVDEHGVRFDEIVVQWHEDQVPGHRPLCVGFMVTRGKIQRPSK